MSKHIHLIGICGTAMASLAGMLKQRGFEVRARTPPSIRRCRTFSPRSAFRCRSPTPPRTSIRRPTWSLSGTPSRAAILNWSACSTTASRSSRWPSCCYDEFLPRPRSAGGRRNARQDHHHLDAGLDLPRRRPRPVVPDRRHCGKLRRQLPAWATDEHFILEGDEYDTAFFDKGPKFLHYFPDAVMLTSVEFDHADIYKDLDAVKTAFKRLVNLVPRRGRIVAWDGAPERGRMCRARLLPGRALRLRRRVALARSTGVRYDTDRTRWSVLREGKPWAEFDFALAGEYNVLQRDRRRGHGGLLPALTPRRSRKR